MKKNIIMKGIVAIVVFVISVIVIGNLMNKSSMDITMEMSKATYPLVAIKYNGQTINYMHGYKRPMQTNYMRDSITPMGLDRNISVVVDKMGCNIKGMEYEVRSVDGSRLVENTQVYNYLEAEDSLSAQLSIKDLIEDEQEYTLVVILQTENGESLRYYTRIIASENYQADDKISFALDFSEKTFDKVAAKELTKFLESNSEGDNTTYSRVTINSSFSQITWGELNAKRVAEPEVYVKELASQTGTIELRYMVSTQNGKETTYYNVVEAFRVREGTERMYLLDYERTMEQIFNWENTVFANNKIQIGISGKEMEIKESDGGSVVAFVQESRLFVYDASDNKFSYVYGFYDEDNWDARTLYQNFDMKILKVDETGNVRFIVYGYMNRGTHEGEVGAQVYYYNSTVNTIEEEVFIPYTKSFDILRTEIEELAYVNNSNQLYLILDASLYCVDLEGKSYSELITNLPIGSYEISDSNRTIVWQEGKDQNACTKLNCMNFNTRSQTSVDAGTGQYIKPIGFMGEDLIYGIAKESDLTKDASGSIVFPMYCVKIQGEKGDVLKTYKKDGYYVMGAQIVDNQINLKRVRKASLETETGGYISVEDDQILDNDEAANGSSDVEIVATEDYEKILQIALNKEIKKASLKFKTPKEVMYEGGRELNISLTQHQKGRYYIYGLTGLDSVEEDASNAILRADEISGVVQNDAGSYVWMKSNRATKNQIMKIEAASTTEEKDSVAICLDTILKLEGITKNTELMLNRGQTAFEILEDNLEGAQVLDLSGCSLDSVLYYVNRDIPVLAILDDGNAVLIVGFNELNTVIMDPHAGTISKKGMNDSTQWFLENGNRFITYIK